MLFGAFAKTNEEIKITQRVTTLKKHLIRGFSGWQRPKERSAVTPRGGR
jgi:hypothetical protein